MDVWLIFGLMETGIYGLERVMNSIGVFGGSKFLPSNWVWTSFLLVLSFSTFPSSRDPMTSVSVGLGVLYP